MALAHLRYLHDERWRGLTIYEVVTDMTPDDYGPMPTSWSSFGSDGDGELDDGSDATWSFMWQSEAERLECLAIDVIEGRRPSEDAVKDPGFRRYARRIAGPFREEESVPKRTRREAVVSLMAQRIWERRLLPTSDHETYGYGVFLDATKLALMALSRLPLPDWVRVVTQKRKGRVLLALPSWATLDDVKCHLETGQISREAVARMRVITMFQNDG